jgi:hypothetical protein
MPLGIDIGPNPPTAVLALHLFIGLVFVGLGVQNAMNGRPLGLALNGLLGFLIATVGVAAARILARR